MPLHDFASGKKTHQMAIEVNYTEFSFSIVHNELKLCFHNLSFLNYSLLRTWMHISR